MATIRQVEANRENALRSTGPRTEEGKENSRRNAVRHGLAGLGIVLPEEEEDKVRERSMQWMRYVQTHSHQEAWIAEMMVIESVRVESARKHEHMVRRYESARALKAWDDDRRLEAEERLERLSRQPATVSRMLKSTSQGCAAVIERLEALVRAIDEKGSLDETDRACAHDLLGTPHELRGGDHRLDTPEQAWITLQAEIEALEADRSTRLLELEHIERLAAEQGCAIRPSRNLQRAQRYLEACLRRFAWAYATLEPDHEVLTRAAARLTAPAATDEGTSPAEKPEPANVETPQPPAPDEPKPAEPPATTPQAPNAPSPPPPSPCDGASINRAPAAEQPAAPPPTRQSA